MFVCHNDVCLYVRLCEEGEVEREREMPPCFVVKYISQEWETSVALACLIIENMRYIFVINKIFYNSSLSLTAILIFIVHH